MSTLSPQNTQLSFGIFDLAEVFGSGEAAIVVMKLRAWLAFNQVNNPHISYRDGRWWTFRSLKKWCEKDFKWLTPRQLGTIMDRLESMKVITRRQYGASELKMSYWYSVNEDVLAELVKAMKTANAFDADVKCSDIDVESFDMDVEYKTVVKQKQNQRNKKNQTTTADEPITEADADPTNPSVVVVDLPRPTQREAESGEHSLNGEAPIKAQREPTLVKATDGENSTATATSLSKVPQKVLSPQEDQLRADLVAFGVTPDRIDRLIQQYPEADIRYVMAYALRERGVTYPPGFLVSEMAKGLLGVLGLREKNKHMHETTAATLDDARLDAIRRENERMAAEDAERERAAQMSDSTGHLTQTLNSIEHLEYA